MENMMQNTATLSMPNTAPVAEKAKTIPIRLLNDVWVQDPDGAPGDTLRLETNIIQYDDEGKIKIDPKTKAPITETRVYDVEIEFAKRLLAAGKAERADPLPS